MCYRGCGEGDCHGGALPGLGLGGDGVAEGGAYLPSEEKAHSGGFRSQASVLAGEERIEDPWKVLNRDPDPMIAYCERQSGLGDVGLIAGTSRELVDQDKDAPLPAG